MSTSKLLQRKLARDCELEFRVYSFRELASLYFPHYQPSSASRALRQLIKSAQGKDQRDSAASYDAALSRFFIEGAKDGG